MDTTKGGIRQNNDTKKKGVRRLPEKQKLNEITLSYTGEEEENLYNFNNKQLTSWVKQ